MATTSRRSSSRIANNQLTKTSSYNILLPPLADDDADEPPPPAPLPTRRSNRNLNSTSSDGNNGNSNNYNDNSSNSKRRKVQVKDDKENYNTQSVATTSNIQHSKPHSKPPIKSQPTQQQPQQQSSRTHSASKIPKPLKIPNLPEQQSTPQNLKPKSLSSKHIDISAPLPIDETPAIKANKDFRKSRRSSVGNRGKRSSSWSNSGIIIPPPHPDLNSSEFCRHIDEDLPDPRRFRILFEWCKSRACNPLLYKPKRSKRGNNNISDEDKLLYSAINNNNVVLKAQSIIQQWSKNLSLNAPAWMPKNIMETKSKPKIKNPENEKYLELIKKSELTVKRLEEEDEQWTKLRSKAKESESISLDSYNSNNNNNNNQQQGSINELKLDHLPDNLKSTVNEILNFNRNNYDYENNQNFDETISSLRFILSDLESTYHRGTNFANISQLYTDNVMKHYLNLLRSRLNINKTLSEANLTMKDNQIDSGSNSNENINNNLSSTLSLATSNMDYVENDAMPLLRALCRPLPSVNTKNTMYQSNTNDDDLNNGEISLFWSRRNTNR